MKTTHVKVNDEVFEVNDFGGYWLVHRMWPDRDDKGADVYEYPKSLRCQECNSFSCVHTQAVESAEAGQGFIFVEEIRR